MFPRYIWRSLRNVVCTILVLALVYSLISYGKLTRTQQGDMTKQQVQRANDVRRPLETKNGDEIVGQNVSLAILLSYQRTGSSFIGRVMRDVNSSFFLYEPLDPLYTSMYGSSPGWNLPDDIFNTKDGRVRTPPIYEKTAVIWTLERIFTCELSSFPVSFFTHMFWIAFEDRSPVVKKYNKCVKKEHKKLPNCQKILANTCGGHFSGDRKDAPLCFDTLWGRNLTQLGPDFVPATIRRTQNNSDNSDLSKQFQEYFECLKPFVARTKYCAQEFLDKECRARSFRSVKTVRAWMDIPEYFLEKFNSTFRLVHSYRDPRGAVRGRWDGWWTKGKECKKDIRRNAECFCVPMERHFEQGVSLAKTYPNKVLSIYYEDLLKDRVGGLSKMLKFLKISEERRPTIESVRKDEPAKPKWMTSLSVDDVKNINDACQHFMKTTNHVYQNVTF